MSQKRYQCIKANLCYMLKEFSILLKIYTGMKEEDTLFTKYMPTRGMNIHIYNYLKHNICLTKTKIQLHILITCHLYAQCG